MSQKKDFLLQVCPKFKPYGESLGLLTMKLGPSMLLRFPKEQAARDLSVPRASVDSRWVATAGEQIRVKSAFTTAQMPRHFLATASSYKPLTLFRGLAGGADEDGALVSGRLR